MAQSIRIYLAWQKMSNGKAHIRRWSPDRAVNLAQNKYVFLGYEAQSVGALLWLGKAGEPVHPECYSAPIPSTPYSVVAEDSPSVTAWRPKAENYISAEEFKNLYSEKKEKE